MSRLFVPLLALTFSLIAGSALACDKDDGVEAAAEDKATVPADATLTKVVLNISDATCGGCLVPIRKELTALEGVTEVVGSEDDFHEVIVTVANAAVTPEQLVAAVKKAGYTATVKTPETTS